MKTLTCSLKGRKYLLVEVPKEAEGELFVNWPAPTMDRSGQVWPPVLLMAIVVHIADSKPPKFL